MASTYDVIVDTPKYHRQGKVKLELSGDTARAHLDITDVGIARRGGHAQRQGL